MMDRGSSLVVAGLTLLVVTLAVSAVAAPDRGADTGGVSTVTAVGTPGTPAGTADTPLDSSETPGGAATTTAPTGNESEDGETATGTPTPRQTPPQVRGTLIGVQGSGGYMSGGYAEFVQDGSRQWLVEREDTYFDVSLLRDGRVLAAWMTAGQQDCGPFPTPCARTGFVVIDPGAAVGTGAGATPEVVERFSIPVRSSHNSEIHDVEALPGGGYVLTDMDRERVMIVEDGEITWQWNASSVYEAPPDPTKRDWLHLNDVDRIGEDRFLVSVRNANQLLVLERNGDDGEVVEVINADRGGSDETCTDGPRLYDADGDDDVRCGDPDVFREQHNPQWLGDGAVLVADSGNDRVVELHRRNGVWQPVWVLTGADGRGFEWPRDADRLPNGNTLVTDSRGRRVIEVTERGETVWSRSTGNGIVYEADRLPVGEVVGAPLYATERPPTGRTDTATGAGTADGTTDGIGSGGTATGSGTATTGSGDGTTAPASSPTTDPVVVTPVGPGGGDSLPVFGELASLLRAALPWLPLWLRGPQVALSSLSLLLVVGGALDRWLPTERLLDELLR